MTHTHTSQDGVFTATAPDEETAKRLVEIWVSTPKDVHRAQWSAAARKEAGYPEIMPKKRQPSTKDR